VRQLSARRKIDDIRVSNDIKTYYQEQCRDDDLVLIACGIVELLRPWNGE
jgi:hypothetical protein